MKTGNVLDFIQPVMPENTSAEQALLGALLLDKEAFYALPEDLQPKHFNLDLHGRIFSAIEQAYQQFGVAEATVIKRQFDDALDGQAGGYIARLVSNAVAPSMVTECARHIVEMAVRREIIQSCQRAITQAHDLSCGTPGEIASQLASELDGSAGSYGRYRVSTERQATEGLIAMISERGAAKYGTGIADLDTAMGGGIFAGKLYGILARKKMGKTMLAGTISGNLQDVGVKHLYIALEMGRDEIHQRALARKLGCYESAFRTGFAESSNMKSKIAQYAINAPDARMYVDAPGLTLQDLRHILPVYIRRYGVSGFILDCWQLVKGKGKNQSNAEHLDDVAQWLADTCKKYKVWGLVTAQENRDEGARGGDGIRMACDQLYRLCKSDESSNYAWLEMMDTRYTRWMDVGSETSPSLVMSEKGTHFEGVA